MKSLFQQFALFENKDIELEVIDKLSISYRLILVIGGSWKKGKKKKKKNGGPKEKKNLAIRDFGLKS